MLNMADLKREHAALVRAKELAETKRVLAAIDELEKKFVAQQPKCLQALRDQFIKTGSFDHYVQECRGAVPASDWTSTVSTPFWALMRTEIPKRFPSGVNVEVNDWCGYHGTCQTSMVFTITDEFYGRTHE